MDDMPLPSNALHAAFVLSTRPHAKILSVDSGAAVTVRFHWLHRECGSWQYTPLISWLHWMWAVDCKPLQTLESSFLGVCRRRGWRATLEQRTCLVTITSALSFTMRSSLPRTRSPAWARSVPSRVHLLYPEGFLRCTPRAASSMEAYAGAPSARRDGTRQESVAQPDRLPTLSPPTTDVPNQALFTSQTDALAVLDFSSSAWWWRTRRRTREPAPAWC